MIGSNDRHPSKIDIKFRSISCFVKPNIFSPRKIPILKSINGEFKSGELTGIIGTSGAGKSTFLNIISGYENNFYGNIYYNGENQKFFKEKHQNLSSYIMQDGLLHDLLTVWESMEISARLNLDCSKEKRDLRILEILKTLSLDASKNTLTKKLSGGERRRLSIGVELIKNPPIFFLDEPTSGLDDVAAKNIISLLSNLAHEGRTIVCTIHQPSAVVLEKFDHLICLFGGECTYQGSVQELLPFLEGLDPPLVCPNYHNPADFLLEICHGVYGDYCRKLVQKTEEKYLQDSSKGVIGTRNQIILQNSEECLRNDEIASKTHESKLVRESQILPKDSELPGEDPNVNSSELVQKVVRNCSAESEKENPSFNKYSPIFKSNSAEALLEVANEDLQILQNHHSEIPDKENPLRFRNNSAETLLEIDKEGFQILQNNTSQLPEENPIPNSQELIQNVDGNNSAETLLKIDKENFQILQNHTSQLPEENPIPNSPELLEYVDGNNSAETLLEIDKEGFQILQNHPSEIPEEKLSPNSPRSVPNVGRNDSAATKSPTENPGNDKNSPKFSPISAELETPLEVGTRDPHIVQNYPSDLQWDRPSPNSPIFLPNIDGNCSAESQSKNSGNDKHIPKFIPNSAVLETLLEVGTRDPQIQNYPSKRQGLTQKVDSAGIEKEKPNGNEEKSLGSRSNCVETLLEVPDSAENEVGLSSKGTWGKIGDFERTSILLGRIYQIMLRDRQLTLTRIFSNLILSLVIGIMFYQIGKDGKFTMDNLNYIFFTYIWIMYEACCTTAITFTEELPILKKEYFNGWYSVKNYFFAITFAGVPIQLFTMTIFITISYFMTGQPAEVFRFAIFYLLCFLNCQVAQSFCTFMCVIAQVKTSVYLVLVAIFPFLTFCGFFVHISDAPFFLRWAFDASFIRYAMEGAVHSIMGFDRGKLDCSAIYCHFANTKTFIKQIGFEEQRILLDIFVLVGHLMFFKIAIYVALLFRIGGKK